MECGVALRLPPHSIAVHWQAGHFLGASERLHVGCCFE
jgi:hypothetical protein